jgi:sortase A
MLIVGVVLTAIFAAAHLHKRILSRAAVEHFKTLDTRPAPEKKTVSFADKRFSFDFALWSKHKITAYEQSLSEHLESPLAVLRIHKVNLEVPVLAGTDDLTLNRGVGLIENMARPGERGNVGIAGHRDSFFRVLKDVGPGDAIELETPDRVDIYRVEQILIVKKDDATVLQPTPLPRLTLVTCYPFYFIGSSPKRYIVQGSLAASGRPAHTQSPNPSSVRAQPASPNPFPQME